MALLTARDLRFAGLTAEERDDLDRRFPRRLSLGDQVCLVDYDPAARQVTLGHAGGTVTDPPSPQFLPAWTGWRVVYRDKGRERLVRD